jgi:ACT domain-containing protein
LRVFFVSVKADKEVNKMKIALGKEKGGVKVIKVEGVREKEKEVIVRHEIVPSKWKTWNHDNLLRDWNKKYSV